MLPDSDQEKIVVSDKDGRYIEYPDKNQILQKTIHESEDPNLRELGKKIFAADSGIYEYKFKLDKVELIQCSDDPIRVC